MVSVCFSAPISSGAQSEYNITVHGDHGTFTDSKGNLYNGGTFTGPITLTFNPVGGYEFVKWHVAGTSDYIENLNHITIRSASEDITLTAVTRNYSTSHGLMSKIDVDNLLAPEDEIVNNWSFASTRLERVGSEWKGMPSVPLIVGDTIYVRAGGMLYALDAVNGTAKKFVESPGHVSFYHYLSYGGGVIFDVISHQAFDLDLNFLYDIPSNLVYATYNDGFFYGYVNMGKNPTTHLYEYSIYKTSTDPDKDLDSNGVKINLSKNTERFMVFEQYGQHSPFLVEKDWMFFLQADKAVGAGGYRAITAYNTVTEKTVTKELTGFAGMPWDDGWLTYGNGYFYITAYVAGLFGGIIKGLEDKFSSIMWVKFDFDKGQFEEPRYQDIETKDHDKFRGICSGLVIHNNRGYLNVRASPDDTMGQTNDYGTCMIAFDIMEDGTPVPTEMAKSYMTHGGIVVNTAQEDEGLIHIYMLPYESSAQGIYIFTDELTDGKWQLHGTYTKKSIPHTEWCSQGIRAGPNGEIIYYIDRGYIDSYIPADRNKVTVLVMDTNSAVSSSGTGQSAGSVIRTLYPNAAISGDQVTIGPDKYSIFGLNEIRNYWEPISDPYTSTWTGTENKGITEAPYHYVALLKEGSTKHFSPYGERGWYYTDDSGENVRCDLKDFRAVDAAAGKTLGFFETKPTGLILPKSVTVPYNSTTDVHVSSKADWTFSVLDTEIVEAKTKGDGDLTLTFVSEGITQLVISSEGTDYYMTVYARLSGYLDEEGYMVYRNTTESVDAMGNTVTDVNILRNSKYIVENTEERTVTDGTGKQVSRELVITTSNRHDRYEEGHWVQTKNVQRMVYSPNDILTVHTEYGSESFEQTEYDGTIVQNLLEVEYDRLAGEKTSVNTVKSTKDSVVLIERTVKGKDGAVTDAYRYAYSSYNEDTTARIAEGRLVIDLAPGPVANVIGLRDMLSEGEDLPVVIRTSSVVSEAILSMGAKIGAVLEYSSGGSVIELGPEIQNKFHKTGALVFSCSDAEKTMNAKQKAAVDGRPSFDLRLKCNSAEQHDFGEFGVRLNLDMVPDEGKMVQVWRVDEKGHLLPAKNVTCTNGTVSFVADHLSVYTVGLVTAGGTSVKSVIIDRSSVTASVGDVIQLTASVSPATALNKDVKWSTSNPKVAVVNDGKVTVIGYGTASVYAEADGVKAACSLSVPIILEDLTFESEVQNMYVGSDFVPKLVPVPSDADMGEITWSSDRPDVAKVVDGRVVAISAGDAVITASAHGKTASFVVSIREHVSSVVFENAEARMLADSDMILTPIFGPENSRPESVLWSSSDITVAGVNNGKVTALRAGTVTIKAVVDSSLIAECEITVFDPDIPAESVTLNTESVTLIAGQTCTLTATVAPADAQYFLRWITDSPGVVSIDGGKITALSAGTAVITVTAGKAYDTCTVTVLTSEYSVTVDANEGGKAVCEPSSNIEPGRTVTVTVSPDEGYKLESLSAEGIEFKKSGESKYFFVMPASDVTVKAVFGKISEEVDPDPDPEGPDTGDTDPDTKPGTSDSEKEDNKTLIFAGVGGIVAILAIAGIFLMKRRG